MGGKVKLFYFDKLMKRACSLIICIILVVAIAKDSVLAQSKKKLKAVEANSSIKTTANIKVPYIVEIDTESAKNGVTITLATNAVTIIRCPEEPVNFLPGSTIGIDVFQAADFEKDLGRNEIYVRPRVAGINTNLAIEFASGPIVIYFKIIEVPGGNNAGDFTGEVVIKNSHYKNELIETKSSLASTTKDNESLKARIAELEKQLKEKVVSSCQEDRLTTLRLVEDSVIFITKKNTVQQSNIAISQLGRVQKVKGGWILNLAIENKGKDFLSLDSLETNLGKVLTTWSLPKKLSPKVETKLSLFIEDQPLEPQSQSQSPLQSALQAQSPLQNGQIELTLLISGSPIKLKTSY